MLTAVDDVPTDPASLGATRDKLRGHPEDDLVHLHVIRAGKSDPIHVTLVLRDAV